MHNEIDAAYDAARQLLTQMAVAASYKDHPMTIRIDYASDDPAEQWNELQQTMAKPRLDIRPMPAGLSKTTEALETQIPALSAAFAQIPSYLMRQGYAQWKDGSALGIRYRYVHAVLRDIGYPLLLWTKQFAQVFCHEKSHVIGSAEYQALRNLRNECQEFTQDLYWQLSDRIEFENGTLLNLMPPRNPTAPQPVLEHEQQSAEVPPRPKQPRRKRAVAAEKNMQEMAFEYLKLWHRYGTEQFISDPIPVKADWQQWMRTKSSDQSVPSPPTVTRMLHDKFGSHQKYEQACRAGRIETLLKVAAGDAAKVFQGHLRERSTTDLN